MLVLLQYYIYEMPRLKTARSGRIIFNTDNKSKDKLCHEAELLPSKILIALVTCMDYKEWGHGEELLEKVFKEYKRNKDAVRDGLLKSMKYIMKTRYLPDKDLPPPARQKPRPKRSVLKKTKILINQVAKRIWKNK